MKKSIFLLIIPLLLATALTQADVSPLTPQGQEELIIYNRILAKVNGKTLSVIDVMKKMDLFLQRNYPDLVNSKVARYQFYSSHWRDTLSQMVDQELMLADAERLELKVTDAEVREEMLDRFGPAIMATLDQLDLTYEEARKMIHTEMVVQRMLWFRVNSKALNTVNPQEIKQAYKQFCLNNPPLEEWEYQVLSLRSPNRTASETIAAKAFSLLHSAQGNFQTVADQIKSEVNEDDGLVITLSSDLQADEKGIAESHKEVLKTLEPGTFSPPIAQVSRIDNSTVYRIFHLKQHQKKETPPFEKMADQLKDTLLDEAAMKENTQYLTKLRERMGYDEKHMLEVIPDDFHPFALR
jgi:hypothetical protein